MKKMTKKLPFLLSTKPVDNFVDCFLFKMVNHWCRLALSQIVHLLAIVDIYLNINMLYKSPAQKNKIFFNFEVFKT